MLQLARAAFALALSLLSALAGCGTASGSGGERISPETWKLELQSGGERATLSLDALNVYLTELDDEPERFEIEGPGVFLSGSLPLDARVGYGEDWKALFGRRIELGDEPSLYDEEREPAVELPDGTTARVLGGHLVFEKLSGSMQGSEGDLTLHGRVELELESDTGGATWSGRIAVHCVSWG